MVVEDDDITRAGFGAILRQRGHIVKLAGDGREALHQMQEGGPPDLIILDMLMDGMDGWQFLQERQRRWGAVPFLIVTGIDTASDEWAASLGARSWLQKPINTDALLHRVEKCLRS